MRIDGDGILSTENNKEKKEKNIKPEDYFF